MVHGHIDVCPYGVLYEGAQVVSKFGLHHFFDRRTDAIDDRSEIARLTTAGLQEFFQSRADRTAFRMSKNDYEPGAIAGSSELDAADLRGRNDIACNTNDKEIAYPLIENDLGRYP